MRSASGRPPHGVGGTGVVRGGGSGREPGQQLPRGLRSERVDRQRVDAGRRYVEVERFRRRDEDEAVGAFRDQGADLLGPGGVVEDDDDGHVGEVLLVLVGQAPQMLLLGGALAEQELFAGCAEPVEQVQQRVPYGQRALPGRGAAQVDDAGAAELVPELLRGAHRERGAPRTGLAVQDDHDGLRGGGHPRLVHPLGDLPQRVPAAGERPLDGGQLGEGLLQDAAPPRGGAAVGAALRRHLRGGRCGAPAFQERPYTALLHGLQPGLPQVLRPRPAAARRQRGRHGRPGERHHAAHAQRRGRRGAPAEVRHARRDGGDRGHQRRGDQRRPAARAFRRQRGGVRGVLGGRRGSQLVDRRPCLPQRLLRLAGAAAPRLTGDGAFQQP